MHIHSTPLFVEIFPVFPMWLKHQAGMSEKQVTLGGDWQLSVTRR